ncbi:MAG: hypothetical protein Q9202_000879 [Teloschistes flavicans]
MKRHQTRHMRHLRHLEIAHRAWVLLATDDDHAGAGVVGVRDVGAGPALADHDLVADEEAARHVHVAVGVADQAQGQGGGVVRVEADDETAVGEVVGRIIVAVLEGGVV